MKPIVLLAAVAALAAGPALAQSGGGQQAARAACAADVQKLCQGVQPGGGRLLQCLKAHATQVSAGCKWALAQLRAGNGQSAGQGAGGAH